MATGGNGNYTFTATNTLPPGLSLTPNGQLIGQPSSNASSPYTIDVKVTDSSSDIANQSYTLTIDPALTLTPASNASLPQGIVGEAYPTTTFTAGGGNNGPYTLAISPFSNLPPGLMFAVATGVLSGTPTMAGGFNFTITASDGTGATINQGYFIDVNPALSLPPATLPSAMVGVPYNQVIMATGGSGPYNFAATNTLPPGLSLTPNGQFIGQPSSNANSPYTIDVQVTDSLAETANQSYTLSIIPAITITPSNQNLGQGTIGNTYPSTTFTAGGGAGGPYTLALAPFSNLPPGMMFNASPGAGTGVLSGMPTAIGGFNFTITATDSSGATNNQGYFLNINPAPSLPASVPSGTVGNFYLAPIMTNGGNGNNTYSETGPLPKGVTFNKTVGLLVGTPTSTIGSPFHITVKVTTSNGATASQAYTLVINPALAVSPASLPAGRVGAAYPSTAFTGTGGAVRPLHVHRIRCPGRLDPLSRRPAERYTDQPGLVPDHHHGSRQQRRHRQPELLADCQPRCSPTAIFTDNFNRANSTNLGSNWTTFIGQMGISGDMAAGQSGLVDLAQVNGVSLTNAAVSAVTNVGTTGERYAGVFARRNAAGDMYVAMLGVNSAANPAGSPTAALLFRFTPGLLGTVSGGWSFLTYTLLPSPPNTGSANLGLDVTGTGLGTTLHLYLNGTLTLTFVESETATIGVSNHPLNNPGGVGLLSVDAGTTYGNFIAGLPGSVPQAQELAGIPKSGAGVSSLTAAELAPIVTEAEARWEGAGLSPGQLAQVAGIAVCGDDCVAGLFGRVCAGDDLPGRDGGRLGLVRGPDAGPRQGIYVRGQSATGIAWQWRGRPCGPTDSCDARDGSRLGLAGHHGAGLHRPDG